MRSFEENFIVLRLRCRSINDLQPSLFAYHKTDIIYKEDHYGEKNLIIIPSLSSFENTLGIYDRKMKGALFIPNKSKYINLYSLQSTLRQLEFLDLFGWVTNEKGFQRGSHRIKKLFDLYNKKEINMAINFESSDFYDISKPIEIVLRLLLTDLEKGMFDDLIDPKDTDYINVRVIQENPDEYLKYSHYESSEVISLADIRNLLLINYDSLRNPKNELDFSKTKGAGSFLNFIVIRFIECQVKDTSFLNKNAVKKLEKYTTSILSNIAVFDRFRIQPVVENNNQEMLTRIMVLKDSNSIGISEIGYGVQYNMLIVLSILEKIITYAKKMQSDEDKQLQTLLIFDEPEIHLHPYLQRTIMKDILKIASGEDVEFNST